MSSVAKRKSAAPLRTVTGQRYDTQFLADGTVDVTGFEIEYIDAGKAPGALFREGLRGDFDICEQALSHYLIARDQGRPLTAIPVFPSHLLPQNTIFVRQEADISSPADLVGKRVAVPDFGYNPAVWARGMLQEHYGVDIEQIIWVENETRPLLGDFDAKRDARFRVEQYPAPEGSFAKGLYGFSEAIAIGQVDAIILPRRAAGTDETLRPLFGSAYADGLSYISSTGVLPINTVMTLTEDAVRRNPGLPAQLLRACSKSLALYAERVAGGLGDSWHQDLDLQQLRADGFFPWSYGLTANRRVLETMLRYCRDQGVITRNTEVEQLFAVAD